MTRIPLSILAPEAPPCFRSRTEWVEYLDAAELAGSSASTENSKPIKRGKGIPPNQFDPLFSFCRDCDAAYRHSMQGVGRCQPMFILEAHGMGRRGPNGHAGKHPFPTETEAHKVALVAARRSGVPIREYHCTECGQFHVGEKVKKAPPRVKRRSTETPPP